jgi:undecaprenyl-diphosphatase
VTVIEALILGLVQGLTEFLPVSSSGHLVLAEHLLDLSCDDITFEVAIHFATLLAVVMYFSRSLSQVFFSPFKMIAGRYSEDTRRGFRMFIAVCLGTVPAVVIGLFFKDQIESAFSSVLFVSILLLVTSMILLSTRFAVARAASIGAGNGFLIGCAQALAILPGISRSGSTIAAALFCGIDREKAFNFSFILSLPAIVGASALTAIDMFEAGVPEGGAAYFVGMAAAFVSGYLSLVALKRLVVGGKFHLFGFYTLIVGLIGIIFLR